MGSLSYKNLPNLPSLSSLKFFSYTKKSDVSNKTEETESSIFDNEDKFFTIISEIKLTIKDYNKEAVKSTKSKENSIQLLKKALKDKIPNAAKEHLTNILHSSKAVTSNLMIASKLDAITNRLKFAFKTKNLTDKVAKVTLALSDKMKNPFNPFELRECLVSFEESFDDLQIKGDISSKVLESIDNKTMVEKEVEDLIKELAIEHKIELSQKFAEMGVDINEINTQVKEKHDEKESKSKIIEEIELLS